MRDRWIGWDFRHQFDRLKPVVNNSRFLILPKWHVPNLGSRVLSLCQKRLCSDWIRLFGYPVVLMETFVDPEHFHGTVYKAANWSYVGKSKGYRRTHHQRASYTPHSSPKMVFRNLPAEGDDELKRTNEIKMFQPLLDTIPDIQGKTITADALLTQRSIARYLVEDRQAHYLFTVKGNQPTPGASHCTEPAQHQSRPLDHRKQLPLHHRLELR